MRCIFLLPLLGCGEPHDGAPVEDADRDGIAAPDDCDDGDSAIHPGAAEVCDGVDNDCDGGVDVDAVDAVAYFADADGDGYGTGNPTMSCTPVAGTSTEASDCDDTNAAINPLAVEICDDLDTDEDCDTLVNEEDDSLDVVTATIAYPDADGDGYGDAELPTALCSPRGDYIEDGSDCDDTNDTVHPGVVEVCDDGLDNNCDGSSEECRRSGVFLPADVSATISSTETTALGVLRGVVAAWDTNGDGFDDLLVPSGDRNAYLFDGPVGDTTADAATATFSTSVGYLMHAVGIGDQNADGYDDLALTEYSGTGIAIVLSPTSGAVDPWEVAAATIETDDEDYGQFGYAPTSGDIDGDGVPDLLFGSYFEDSFRGHAYAFLGPITTGALDPSDADWTIIGDHWGMGDIAGSELGAANSANGDVDGDGTDDWLIGTYTDTGWAALFYGPPRETLSESTSDFFVDSGAPFTAFGGALSVGGDLDGDGRQDVVVVQSELDRYAGAVYVFFASAIESESSAAPSDADATLVVSYMSGSFDSAGDFDGDGTDDLLLGTNSAGLGFYGPIADGLTEDSADFSVTTFDEDWNASYTVGFVGDLNDDGGVDIAVGDMVTTAPEGGVVYVLNGAAF